MQENLQAGEIAVGQSFQTAQRVALQEECLKSCVLFQARYNGEALEIAIQHIVQPRRGVELVLTTKLAQFGLSHRHDDVLFLTHVCCGEAESGGNSYDSANRVMNARLRERIRSRSSEPIANPDRAPVAEKPCLPGARQLFTLATFQA